MIKLERVSPLRTFLFVVSAIAFTIHLSGCGENDGGGYQGFLDSARNYVEGGETAAAVIEYKSAIQANPAATEARLELGRLYVRLGDGASAYKELVKAQELGVASSESGVLVVRALSLVGDAVAAREHALALVAKEATAKHKLLLAEIELKAGNVEAAQTLNQAVLDGAPDDAEAVLGMARISLHNRDYDKALSLLARIGASDSRYAAASLVRGQIKNRTGDFESALVEFERSANDPASELASEIGRGRALLGLRRSEDVNTLMDELERKYPNLIVPELFQGLAAYGDKKFSVARDKFLGVLSKAPSHQTALLYSGLTASEMGQLEQAEDYLNTVLNSNPDNVNLRKLVASIQLKRKNFDDVLRTIEDAGEVLSDDAIAAALKGTALLNKGEVDAGLRELEMSSTLSPDDNVLQTQLIVGKVGAGQFEQALDLLSERVDISDQTLNAELLEIYIFIRAQRYDEALAGALKLANETSANVEVYNALGLSHLGKEQISDAKAAFARGLEIDPEHIALLQNLILASTRAGDSGDLPQLFERLIAAEPDNARSLLMIAEEARAAGKVDEAIALMEKSRLLDSNLIAPRIGLGSLYLQRNNIGRALQVSREALRIEPENLMALLNLGGCLLALERHDGALNLADKLVALYPDSPLAAFFAGNANFSAGKYAEARKELNRAQSLRDGYLAPKLALARVAAAEGDAATAQSYLEELEADDDFDFEEFEFARLKGHISVALKDMAQAAVHFAKAFSLTGLPGDAIKTHQTRFESGQVAAAIQGTEAALKKLPDFVPLRAMLADTYRAAGQRERAIAEYRKIVESEPTLAIVLNNLAMLEIEAGEVDVALEHARQADLANPDNPAILDTLGVILTRKGNYEEAVSKLTRAYSLYSDSGEIGFHLASAQLQVGLKREAIKVLQEITLLTPFPGQEKASDLLKKLDR